jgi:ketosteroid isomerase-like protein
VSLQDIELVRAQFEGVNARNFEGAMGLYADDVVLVVHSSFGLETGTFEGKEAVGDWFGQWFQIFSPDYRFRIEEAREIGEVIFIHAKHGGRGRTSGVEVRDETSYLYSVRSGRVVRVELFGERDEALQAASLPEWSKGETD